MGKQIQLTDADGNVYPNAIFTLAITIPANTDLNSLDTSGFYQCNSSTNVATLGHCPVTSAFSLYVFYRGGGVAVTQLLVGNTTMYLRGRTSSGWTDWQAFYSHEIEDGHIYYGSLYVPAKENNVNGILNVTVPSNTRALLAFIGLTVGTHNWGLVGLYSSGAASMRTVLLSDSSNFSSITMSAPGSNKFEISNSGGYGCTVLWLATSRIYKTT